MATAKNQQHHQPLAQVSLARAASRAESENNPRLQAASINNNNNQQLLARWPLAKYACFITSSKSATMKENQQPGMMMNNTWLERTAGGQQETPDMWIQITQRRFIQILHGDAVVECCPLSDARREWRCLRKGREMLVNISANNKTGRKFRIRFLEQKQQDAVAVAQACQQYLSRYLTFLDLRRDGSQQSVDSFQHQQHCVELKELAKAILDPRHSKWPQSYLDMGKNSKKDELSTDLIQSCLMDPGFPALVEAVEKSLKKLMSTDDL